MASLEDQEDSGASSSENEDQDETMMDADEPEGEATQELNNSMQDDDDADENEDEEDEGQEAGKEREDVLNGNGAQTDERTREYKTPDRNLPPTMGSPPIANRPQMSRVRQEMIAADMYDIVPTVAAPHSTSINAVTATDNMRWIFSGGQDGWIRKFNWVDTVNAKTLLTVAQRHPFVDSVTKAGVLMSYWENEEPSESKPSSSAPQDPEEALQQSPVYSLAVHPQAVWLLSGTEMGAINLYSVRIEEGKRITSLIKHTSAVSVMQLVDDNKSVLSGSWDKVILDSDLNNGNTRRNFSGSRGQISAIEIRPESSVPVPRDTLEQPIPNGLTTNNSEPPKLQSAEQPVKQDEKPTDGIGSPMGSLFGDTNEHNSLFGDDPTAGGDNMFEENDEFSRAIADGIPAEDGITNGDATSRPPLELDETPPASTTNITTEPAFPSGSNGLAPAHPNTSNDISPTITTNTLQVNGATNGLSPVQSTPLSPPHSTFSPTSPTTQMSESTFLDAAIDGPLRIWDRRQPNPVARMLPPRNTPPWCMHACWSPDGNFFYAGRRNGTVDEYSLHHTLSQPTRTLKLPSGSGAVTNVRAMPNSRHLICASYDILRLYDLSDDALKGGRKVPFTIVPGHRTGVVSNLFLDRECRFLISTGGTRGWEGSNSEVLLGYEIGETR